MILLLLLIDRFNFILAVLDGGGGGGGSLGRVGVLVSTGVKEPLLPAFSLKDCEIPRLPNLEALNASLTDGLVFIRIRVVSLKRCECLAPLPSSAKSKS